MRDRIICIIIVIGMAICFVSLMSSFHQSAREEQLRQRIGEFQDFNTMYMLACQGDEKALKDFVKSRYWKLDYCVCVPWSEKMIKKMGPDIYHGTKRIYKMSGGK